MVNGWGVIVGIRAGHFCKVFPHNNFDGGQQQIGRSIMVAMIDVMTFKVLSMIRLMMEL